MIPIITNQDNKKISQVKSNKEEIYLESRGFCTIGEIKETSESEGFQVKGQLVLAQIADKIAKDKNISKTEAFNLIYPANPDVETEDQRNIWREYPDLIKEMTLMKSGADNMKAIAATIMIKTRVAYPLETSSILSFGAESISTKPLRFPIEENKFIVFPLINIAGSPLSLEVTKVAPEGATLLSISTSPVEIPPKTIAFLGDSKGKVKVGAPKWTLDDTLNLSAQLVDKIFDFYRKEKEEEPTEDPSNQLTEGN